MNREFDDVFLSSYVDGELDPESMGKAEVFIEKDINARRYVLNAFRTTARLRASVHGVLSEEIPERLARTVLTQQGETLRRFFRLRPFLQMAAAVLLVLLGVGVKSLFPVRTNAPIANLKAPFPAGYNQVVSDALEHNLSGKPLQWQSPEKFIITVTPVQTYRDKNGRFFREFRMEVQTVANRLQISGLAYRQKGEWKTKAVYYQ